MEALRLIQSIEQFGCFLQTEGENVRIFNSNRLPVFLKDQLKSNKDNVIEVLLRDEKARKAGFIVGLTGELYTRTINSTNVVYIERIKSEWQAWRETYLDNRVKTTWYKVISNSENFDQVLVSAVSFLII